MTEKRNTDWTDKLRERLSDSELSPSADVWSKVESTAVPARKVVPASAWWGFACAAAALAALLFIPKPQRSLTAEVLAVGETDPLPVDAETVAPMTQNAGPVFVAFAKSSFAEDLADADADDSAADDGYAVAAHSGATDDSATPALAEDSADPAVAETSEPAATTATSASSSENEITGRGSAMECGFETEQYSKPRKKLGVSLFASGIPGNSGQTSRPDIIVVHPGYSMSPMIGSSLTNSYGSSNNYIVVVDDLDGSFASNAGSMFQWNQNKPGEGNGYYQALGYEVMHHRPISFGVAFTYPLVRNLFLESGLSYTFLRSEFAGNLGDQRLHFLGVPLKLGYRIHTPSNFSVALSAGVMAEKCVYATLFDSRITIKDPQFSAVANASVNYNMGQHISLFVAPELDYYFTQTSVPTYRTERPLSMTLRLGVNLDLGK